MAVPGQQIIPDMKKVHGIIVPRQLSDDRVLECMRFVPNPGDILLCTYPKSGTNWLGQIVTLLKFRGRPPRSGVEFYSACPFFDMLGPECLLTMEAPRCYKIHFQFKDAPKSPLAKYICVVRNPKDCLISLYHFMKHDVYGFKDGTFETLFSQFLKGEVLYNDYFDHLMSWYERRDEPNVLFLYYEKMKRDPKTAIKAIGKFMGSEYEDMLADSKLFEQIVNYSSFEYMKRTTDDNIRKSVKGVSSGEEMDEYASVSENTIVAIKNFNKNMSNFEEGPPPFVRKGVVGDWKTMLTEEQNATFDELIKKRIGGTDVYDYWKQNGCI